MIDCFRLEPSASTELVYVVPLGRIAENPGTRPRLTTQALKEV
jgi:hypothetical protein